MSGCKIITPSSTYKASRILVILHSKLDINAARSWPVLLLAIWQSLSKKKQAMIASHPHRGGRADSALTVGKVTWLAATVDLVASLSRVQQETGREKGKSEFVVWYISKTRPERCHGASRDLQQGLYIAYINGVLHVYIPYAMLLVKGKTPV